MYLNLLWILRSTLPKYSTNAIEFVLFASQKTIRIAGSGVRMSRLNRSYGITGSPAAIVVAASLQTGCPQPCALTPIGNPVGFVMS
jgi:hypothetical protein